jgi:dipeptidyl aminopeptidase/acylaminoacyl peptidase
MHSKIIPVIMGIVACLAAGAQTQQQKLQLSYRPSRTEVLQRYQHMSHLDSTARNALYKMRVQANWQASGNSFWYSNNGKDSTLEYVYVDVLTATKRPAFDHQRMADALSKASGKKADATHLKIGRMLFDDKQNQVQLEFNSQWYSCDLNNYSCTALSIAPVTAETVPDLRTPPRWQRDVKRDSVSPDKQWIAYIKDDNVFVKSIDSAQVIQFTTDGTATQPYGSLYWSPDGKYVVGYKIEPRVSKEVYYVLTAQPNTTRGILRSHGYAQPGDEFTSYEMYVFNLASKKPLKVNTEKYNFLGQPWLRWRSNNSRYFTYEKADRGHQRFRIIEVDAETGNTRHIIDEKTNTFIYEQRIFTHYIPETNEIIWSSEKDGWRHLYLVDAIKGSIKSQITKGEWVVREIDSVDTKKREIWFRASGMHPGEDPYNRHVYRISFDGKKLLSLTPAPGNHTISYSPDRKYYIDTWSQPHTAPVHVLGRTADGKQLMQLEQADISAYLALGIKLPEIFVAKGRDGKTDIWGVVCRPSHFDSTKQYPVIENIYAGPQDAFVPKNFMPWGEMQSMAELGFIVVQCDGMGTANRSKAFHDVCWKNLGDAGLPDRIAWIKALAVKYPYIDTTRVGAYGTSAGGQNSAGALLFHPEFYKAAVSACGCHDNRVDKQWWNEQWMGYPVGKHYDEQSNITNAAKLQGKLLLIVGEADTNVPPESTYRLADALIKAGKTFDFLAIPGMGHSDGGVYGRAKKRDFFVKQFLGVDPPDRNINELAN